MMSLSSVDYNIHGLVGIRLLDASPADAAAVSRQLGPLLQPLSVEPDIVVRFVKQLPTPALRLLGLNKQGFADDGYFILRSSKADAKVRVDFSQIGQQCEIVCESGLRSVPLLTAILNLTVLKKGCVPLHASAFTYKGTGILVTGWSKAGKTEALLAFASRGAQYVGDEWVILSGDGQRMYGVPENIRLWDWHLGYLPQVRRRVKREERFLFSSIRWLDRMQAAIGSGRLGDAFPVKFLRRSMPALRRQLNVTVAPQTIFGSSLGRLEARPEKVFLLMTHQETTIDVEPCDPLVVARRMASSVRYELLAFMEHYLAFKFAFPEKRNDFIERAHEIQDELLRRALAGKETYVVLHPYPVRLNDLFESMKAFCGAAVQEAVALA